MSAVTNRMEAPEIPARLANVEMELALVGGLLMDNRRVDIVADMLTRDDFSEPLMGRIYERVVNVVSGGGQAAAVTIAHEFANDPAMEVLGGAGEFLAKITNTLGLLVLRPRETAKTIANLSRQRQLHAEARRIAEALEQGVGDDIAPLIDQADAALSRLTDKPSVSRGSSFAKAFDRTIERIRAEARGEVPRGIAIAGLDDFNQLFGPVMRAGGLIYLAGRPGMGKTGLLVETMLASARAGNGTAVFSLEMDVDGLTMRGISSLIYEHGNSLAFDKLQKGEWTAFDEQRIAEAREQIDSWPLELRYDPGLTIAALGRSLRRIKREMSARGQELRVVLVDYLQLMSGGGKNQNRSEIIAELSRGLKVLAGELGVLMIVLSQLSRKCEEREDKRPQLSDLRESGAIEQDADAVGFVFREQYYLEMAEPKPGDKKRADWETDLAASRDRMELIAAKVRQGKTGRRRLHYFLDNQAVRGSRFYQDRDQ